MKLTEKVSAWANKSGNTKAHLCELLDISPNTLTSRLQGETEWTWPEAVKLAKYLELDLNDLVD